MYNLAVVVLNYKKYEETMDCVNSLLKQTYDNFRVIIVDNGSANGSGGELRKVFAHEKKVTILESKINLGFSKGNNIGIKYARQKLQYEFVLVLNSDTILTDIHTLEKIVNEYEKGTGVISTYCCDVNGMLQRPSYICSKRVITELYKGLIKDTINSILAVLGLYEKVNRERSILTKKHINYSEEYKYEYVISGCAFILTPDFFENYNQLYPRTFLYAEEKALVGYLYKASLKTKCANNPYIIHKGEQSTPKNIISQKVIVGFKSFLKVFPIFFMSKERIKQRYS